MRPQTERWLVFIACLSVAALLCLAVTKADGPQSLAIGAVAALAGIPVLLWRLWRRVGRDGMPSADAVAVQWQSVAVVAILFLVGRELNAGQASSYQFVTGFSVGVMVTAAVAMLNRIAELLARRR